MQCNILPNSGPMPPQHAFANQSAFVGVTTFERRLVNVFTTQIEVVPGLTTRANLQNVATLLPVRFNMEGVPPYDMLGPNEMTFLTFTEVSALPAERARQCGALSDCEVRCTFPRVTITPTVNESYNQSQSTVDLTITYKYLRLQTCIFASLSHNNTSSLLPSLSSSSTTAIQFC
jgi:hypothetical protein